MVPSVGCYLASKHIPSRNQNQYALAERLRIICNLDADNFLGPGFAFWLKECFNTDQNIFVCAGSISDRLMSTDVAGRICVRKEDFDALGGFDESMSGYGFEDFDLIERLESSQIKKRIISNSLFLKAISHSIKTRVIEEFEYRNIETILVSYKTPYKSKMIFLFRNNVFSTGSILNNVSEESSMPSLNTKAYPSNIMLLSEEAWHYGTWTKFVASAFNGIHLEFESDSQMNTSLNFNQSTSTFINQFEIYFIINDRHKIEEAIAYYSQIKNRTTMNRNMGAPNKCVNSGAMGKGIVFKNFDYNTEIRL